MHRLFDWMRVAAVSAALLLAACGSAPAPEDSAATSAPPAETAPESAPAEEPKPEEPPPVVAKVEPPPAPKAAPKTPPAPPANPMVVLKTSKGSMKIELYPDKAPLSVKNFLQYVDDKYYDGTIFHRVIKDFMIQGGGFTPDMEKKDTRPPIENEAKNGLRNERGTIAMARTPNPHSATAQFYINHADNAMLDQASQPPGAWGYAVFGKVVEGMNVLDAIAVAPTGMAAGMSDVPREAIVIESVRRAE